MKALFLALFFCIMAAATNAQKLNFTDTTNKWTVFEYACGGDPTYVAKFIFHYGNNITINDTAYTEFFKDSWLMGYVRYDTSQNKVYFKAASPTYYFPDTIYGERLLYDYTLNVGDTFKASRTKHHVAAIDTVTIRGTIHKVWHLIPDTIAISSMATIPYDVIEGIGSTAGPLNPLLCYFFENCVQLTCFSTNYITPPLSHGVGYAGYFENVTSCDLTFGLGLTTPATNHVPFLSPNPANSELNVELTRDIQWIEISDLTGRRIQHIQVAEPRIKIDINPLNSGLYLLRTNGGDCLKFVKE